jgi:hypothetical protein
VVGAFVLHCASAISTVGADRNVSDHDERCAMPGKFEVYRDKDGKYRFRLKAANGTRRDDRAACP